MEEEPKVLNLNKDVIVESPTKGIWSRTFHKTKGMNAVVMRLAAGEDLTEHTSKYEAVIHVLSGKATVTLGEKSVQAAFGTWIHMPAKTPHSVTAKEDFIMLLYIVK
jgi:quercetin dioxygenase-like cupin family protein